MKMMVTTVLVPEEEYLRTSYDPDCDFVDGVLEERNEGEFDHSDIQSEIVHWFREHGRKVGLNAFTELRCRVRPGRYRIPDVVVLRGKRPRVRVLDTAPVVAIEVLSPEDRQTRMQQRIDEYLALGTAAVWVIDPERRRAWVHTAAGTLEAKDGILRIEDPGFEVPLRELFANIDAMTE